MSPDELRTALEAIHSKLLSRGFDVRLLVFEPPANTDDLAALESRLGVQLPPSFRKLFLDYSCHVEFSWFAPDDMEFPKPFQNNFRGDLHWSLELTEQIDSARRGWVTEVFPNPEDPYDSVWHNKLAFHEVGNGDFLAMNLLPDRYEEIVYLSREDGEGHGYVLAQNIIDLLCRWVPLACTGGEYQQWIPFTDAKESMITPDGDEARKWRRVLGLSE